MLLSFSLLEDLLTNSVASKLGKKLLHFLLKVLIVFDTSEVLVGDLLSTLLD
jgi:hypothetical protein